MNSLILRDFQKTAIISLASRVAEFVENKTLRTSVIEVCAPTGSGKSEIIARFVRMMNNVYGKDDVSSIVVCPFATVVEQLKSRGVANATTTQSIFRSFKKYSEKRGGDIKANTLTKIANKCFGDGSGYLFKSKVLVLVVDESHFGFESESEIYSGFLRFLDQRTIIIGFTATPTGLADWPIIDLSKDANKFTAKPLGSFLPVTSFLSVAFSIGAFGDAPKLVFCRRVINAAALSLALDIVKHKELNVVAAANCRASIKGYIEKTLTSLNKKSEFNDRRLFSILRLIVIGEIYSTKISKTKKKSLLRQLIVEDSGSWLKLVRMISVLNANLSKDIISVITSTTPKNKAAELVGKISNRASNYKFKTAEEAGGLDAVKVSKKSPKIISVYSVGTGFDWPEASVIINAEPVAQSEVLLRQRAGRGARLVGDGRFYDMVDVDILSDADVKLNISWLSMIKNPGLKLKILNEKLNGALVWRKSLS